MEELQKKVEALEAIVVKMGNVLATLTRSHIEMKNHNLRDLQILKSRMNMKESIKPIKNDR